MTILVVGGTGTVGSGVVGKLLEAGRPVRVLTHSPDKLGRLPDAVEPVVADLDAPDTLPPAFAGATTLVLITQMHPLEEARGLAAVAAARAAGVEKIVYLTTMIRPGTDHILHYRSKRAVEDAIRSSGAKHALLRPNSFHQNDAWLQDAILSGVYLQPVGEIGVSRIDARDVSHAIGVAASEDVGDSLDCELHGPEPITGTRTGEIYSEVLGRDVAYGGDDIDAWIKPRRGVWQDWMVDALAEMYRYMQAHGITPRAGDGQAPVLPSRLISTEDYAREIASRWTGDVAVPSAHA